MHPDLYTSAQSVDVLVVPNFDANTVDFFDMSCAAGDLDCNGMRNAKDLVILKHAVTGNILPGSGSILKTMVPADVNGDYVVNTQDLSLLANLLVENLTG